MSSREQQPIVFGNWPKGIAASPLEGLHDAKNVSLSSSLQALTIALNTSALTTPPTVTTLAYTTNTGTDVVTVSSTSGWYNGMAITLNTVVTSTGISTGRVYWVGDLTATTFKLYKSPSRDASSVVDITGSNGSGTLSSYTMTAPLDYAIDYRGGGETPARNYIFILDDSGRVWWVDNTGAALTTNLIYLGNDTLTGTNGRAIAVWKNHIIVFRQSAVDALQTGHIDGNWNLDAAYSEGWSYGWDSVTSVNQARRPVLVGQDDVLYYGNSHKIGSFEEATTFDPTSGASYNKNTAALDLPADDDVESLGELGLNLLIGGTKNYIYPWDRTSASFDSPLSLPENKCTKIVSSNQTVFLFAGTKGNIYITDGTNVRVYKHLPDHLSGVYNPHYTWHDALVWQNQLYFSFTASENDGDALAVTGGVWAIDLITGGLRYSNQLSYGATTGTASVIIPHVLDDTPPGNGLYIGWSNSSTYGVDVTTSTYYTGYSASVISQMFQIGTAFHPRQLNRFMIEFNKELASGEGIKLYFRTSLSGSWTSIGTFDYATYANIKTIEKVCQIQAEKVQFKVELTSGGTTTLELMPITFI